jgi:hypothetical protein
MIQRFYIDPSVFGGLFDHEFELESRLLFDMVKDGRVICLYSDYTEKELVGAPEKVRFYFRDLFIHQKRSYIMESQIIPNFHTVEFFRKIKEKISEETYGLSYEELMAYFANKNSECERLDELTIEEQTCLMDEELCRS